MGLVALPQPCQHSLWQWLLLSLLLLGPLPWPQCTLSSDNTISSSFQPWGDHDFQLLLDSACRKILVHS